jgi:uncharacterized Zn finger protein (UPF0148 family)
MRAACPDCGAALRQDVADDYVACPTCGPFVRHAAAASLRVTVAKNAQGVAAP